MGFHSCWPAVSCEKSGVTKACHPTQTMMGTPSLNFLNSGYQHFFGLCRKMLKHLSTWAAPYHEIGRLCSESTDHCSRGCFFKWVKNHWSQSAKVFLVSVHLWETSYRKGTESPLDSGVHWVAHVAVALPVPGSSRDVAVSFHRDPAASTAEPLESGRFPKSWEFVAEVGAELIYW